MAKVKAKKKLIAENRKAFFNYFIEEKFEAGLVLCGTEVKSLRAHNANIAESYASFENGELWLINAYIVEYAKGNRFNHEPRRPRKFLLQRKQLKKIFLATSREGMTAVPLDIYFNDKGYVKTTLAIARGKKIHDKRETVKQRDWGREKSRLLKKYS